MSARTLAASLGVLAGLAQPLAAQPAPPSTTPETAAAMIAERRAANALYKEGVRLFNAGSFADALGLFEQAYHRYPDARILFSIASTQRQLGRIVAAANSYQRYVDDPGAEPQLVAETRTVLQALDVTLGRIEVTFHGELGELQVADGAWMPAGTRLIRVEPGSFILRARHAGDGGHAEVTGKVSPGDLAPIAVAWTIPPKPPTPSREPASPPTRAPLPGTAPSHALAYGFGAGGLAFGLVAIGLGVSSHGKIADAEVQCPSLRCAEPSYGHATALLDSARTRRDLAYVAGGLAAVGVGVGLVLLLRPHATPRAEVAHVVPIASGHGVGVALGGVF